MILIGITGVLGVASWKFGFCRAWSGSTNSKSRWYITSGSVYTVINSAKVLPRQIRLPPKNGQKENGFLALPFGFR